jgi:two-component system phosphate regulon response regulator PhoB
MATDTPAPTDARTRVLVVDDDLASRILVAILLEKGGYSPTAVGTVPRALERIESDGTDVVVTDLIMPGRGGLDLLESLRERACHTPVIVMTGSDDEELAGRALDLGAEVVLRKLYLAEELHFAVAAALNGATPAVRHRAA